MICSPASFKIAAEAVNGIIFEWDLVAGQITRTRGVREVTGLDPAALRPEPEAWFERMHPGDAKVARAQMAAGLESCSGWTTRYRFRDAAGAYRAMLERSVVKCDAGGTAVRAVGCVVDVSEFDRLTSLLADTERAAQIGGWEYFYRSGSMRWTQEMYRIFDTTPAEFTVTPKAAMDRLAGVSRRALRTAFSAAEAGRGQFDVAVELVSFTEQHRWVRVVGHIERLDGVPFRIHGSLQDITAQRKAQAALESRTDWLALSMRMAHMHAWRWDRGRDVFEFAALDGRVRPLPRVIVNMPELLARVHPEDRASAVQAIERAFASGSQIQGELRIRSASRRYRAYAMVARPVFDAAGEPVGLAGVTRDVTLRHEAESRLRRSEELLRVTTENSADMLMLLDRNLRIRFVNKAPRGTTSEEMIGERLDVFLPLKSRKSVLQRLKRLLTNGLTVTFEYDVPDEFGQPQYFENRAELVREAGIGTGVSVAVRDITQRKRLEREILEVSSRERHSIGRDLHDGLGQELTGVALMLRGLATRLEGRAPEMVDQVNEIVGVVNQSIESVRSLVRGLLPVSLHRGGLAHALRTLATRSRTLYGLDVAFHADVWPQLPLDETGASHLYRIAQEALTNAARHGQATAVDIYLRSTPTTLLLQVADNGCGIAPYAPEPKGMGLKIMEYRAGMIGAKLEIVPNEPQGTIVRIIGQNGHVGLSV